MKVTSRLDLDGFAHFTCPAPGCGKRMKVRTVTGGPVTCTRPGCGTRFELCIAGKPAATPPPPLATPAATPRPRKPRLDEAPPLLPTRRHPPAVRQRPRSVAPIVAAAVAVVLGAVGIGAAILVNRPDAAPTGPSAAGPKSGEAEPPAVAPASAAEPAKPPDPPADAAPSPVKDDVPAKTAPVAPATPAAAPTPPAAVAHGGVRVTGTLKPDHVTQFLGTRTQTSFQWKADVRIENHTDVPVPFGPELLLFEIARDGNYEGFGVFDDKSAGSPSSYGLTNNYERGTMRFNSGGGSFTMTSLGSAADPLKPAPAGGSSSLQRDFPEHTWLTDPVDVCLVLPDVRLKAGRVGLLIDFAPPAAAGEAWSVRGHRLVALDPAELKRLLADPTSTLVTKVLAANWLTEAHPAEAASPLTAAAASLRDGQLLATCLTLMTGVRAAGYEARALELLRDAKVPNGVRALAAEYVGTLRYMPALEALVGAASDKDTVVAGGAIRGLGAFGGPRAVQALTAILRDAARKDEHRAAADSLARGKDAAAIRTLQDAADGGNEAALAALADAGLPETFDYFVRLAGKAQEPARRNDVARGLKSSGGAKAVPVLLELLRRAGAAAEKDLYGDGIVSALADLNAPEATPKLAELAAAGNLRAAQVLARSKNDSVREPLTNLAKTARGSVLRTALGGLADNWAAQSVDAFAAALKGADAEAVRAAIRGVEQGKSARALELLVPVLDHADSEARRAAARAAGQLPPGDLAPKVAAVLLRSRDDDVLAACAKLLTAATWRDPAAIPKLGDKLKAAKGSAPRELVRLLRQMSDNAMGPADEDEWYKDRDGWARKWVEWAGRQTPAPPAGRAALEPDMAMTNAEMKKLKAIGQTALPVYAQVAGNGVVGLLANGRLSWNGDTAIHIGSLGWTVSSTLAIEGGGVLVNVGESPVKVADFELRKGEYALFKGKTLKKVTFDDLKNKRG